MILLKCCTVFTIYCKSLYFHVLHAAFHYVSLKQYTCRITASNKTSQEIQEPYSRGRRISAVHELSITSVTTSSNYSTEQLQKINCQLATQQHLPQQKLLHLGWPAACISCHYTNFMQHQHTPHHPIFTTFITKKLTIKGVNFQIFFTIKNFRILQ